MVFVGEFGIGGVGLGCLRRVCCLSVVLELNWVLYWG